MTPSSWPSIGMDHDDGTPGPGHGAVDSNSRIPDASSGRRRRHGPTWMIRFRPGSGRLHHVRHVSPGLQDRSFWDVEVSRGLPSGGPKARPPTCSSPRSMSPLSPRYLSPCMQSHRSAIRPKCDARASGSGLFSGPSAASDNGDYVVLCSIVSILRPGTARGDRRQPWPRSSAGHGRSRRWRRLRIGHGARRPPCRPASGSGPARRPPRNRPGSGPSPDRTRPPSPRPRHAGRPHLAVRIHPIPPIRE